MAAQEAMEAAARKGATAAEQRAAYDAEYRRVLASFEAAPANPDKTPRPGPKDAADVGKEALGTPQGEDAVEGAWESISSDGNEAAPEPTAQR
jgi:hypothetical protein